MTYPKANRDKLLKGKSPEMEKLGLRMVSMSEIDKELLKIGDVGGKLQSRKIGTLSFPVRRRNHHIVPIYANEEVIAKVIEYCRPGILLCGGSSVYDEASLAPIIEVTKRTKTVVICEVCETRKNVRIVEGECFCLGEQCFSYRKDTDNSRHPGIDNLEAAFVCNQRTFSFERRKVSLLVCGEVMVVEGRKHVQFHERTSEEIQNAIRGAEAIILNPTHTRMANCGAVQAWRKFLSSDGRTYVSASNWALKGDGERGQRISSTLHSLWHNSTKKEPVDNGLELDELCYREWRLPA